MRTFGLELVSASTFFALETLAGFSLFTGRSALAGFSVLAARSGFAGFSAFSPRAARSPLAGLSAFSVPAAALRLALVVLGFLSSCVFSFSEGSASSSRFGAVFLGLLSSRYFVWMRHFLCILSFVEIDMNRLQVLKVIFGLVLIQTLLLCLFVLLNVPLLSHICITLSILCLLFPILSHLLSFTG